MSDRTFVGSNVVHLGPAKIAIRELCYNPTSLTYITAAASSRVCINFRQSVKYLFGLFVNFSHENFKSVAFRVSQQIAGIPRST